MAAPSTWQRFLAAIRAQESGGNYAQDSAGCLGAYCWSNQSSWDAMASAAGQGHYVGQNPATIAPQIQDLVASDNLARAYHSAGNSLQRAAEWWNGGETQSVPNPGLPPQSWAPQCGGGSSGAYACQVLMRMQLGGHYLAGSGGPASPSGSGSGGVVTTAAHAAKGNDCLIGFPGIPGTSIINDAIGRSGNLGSMCFLTYSRARAVVGAGILVAGGLIMLPGVFLIVAAVGTSIPGAKKAAEQTGAVVALIPGAEAAGVAIAGAGSVRSAKATQSARKRPTPKPASKTKQDEASETAAEDGAEAAA